MCRSQNCVHDREEHLLDSQDSLSNFSKKLEVRKKSRVVSKGTYSEVFGPAMSSFDVVVIPPGTKRKRELTKKNA